MLQLHYNAHKQVAIIVKLCKNLITLIYQYFANTYYVSYQSNLIISLEPQKRFELYLKNYNKRSHCDVSPF